MTLFIVYFCLAALIYALWLLLKLHWITAVILLVLLSGAVWLHRKRYLRQKEAGKRFDEACLYLDTVLYAFTKEGKIETALEDAYETVSEGKLKESLKNAINHIKLTFDESEIMSDALKIMEEAYPCKRVEETHEFMLHVEYYGGEIGKQAALLLEDKKRWQMRVEKTIAERRKSFREVILSVFTSLLICGIILYLPVMNSDIQHNPVAQITAALLVIVDDIIIYAAQKFLVADWLNLDSFREEERQAERLASYRAYSEKKGRRLSVLLGTIFTAISLLLLFTGHYWFCLIGLLLSLVLWNQHRIGHFLLGRSLKKEVKSAFPNWLMDLVLLLQSENVQVAIEKSEDRAPEILLGDIRRLKEDLTVNPEASLPYHKFMCDFEMPEIGSAMSMLYSLSMGQGQAGQLESLIENNYELLDQAEQQRLKDRSSGLYLLFLAPVMTASVKLVVDMAVFMLTFISTGLSM